MKIISQQIQSHFETYKGIVFECSANIYDRDCNIIVRARTPKRTRIFISEESIDTFDLDRFIYNLDKEVQACFLI